MPDSSLCRAAAPRLRPLQLLLPTRLHRSVSTAAELPACIRFSCCSRLRPFQLLPDCVLFGCSSLIASTSTLLPDGVRFVCFSPIASASTAAPRLRRLRLCSLPAVLEVPAMSTILEHSTQSSRFSTLKYEGRVSL